jgi:hypothetical protein
MVSYNAKTNKYMFSKKGITIPKLKLKEVIDCLNSLPMDPPEVINKEGNDIVKMVDKYKDLKICISLTDHEGGIKIDIREKIVDRIKTYEGMTYKGVRFEYELGPTVSNYLQMVYNKLFDPKENIDIVS